MNTELSEGKKKKEYTTLELSESEDKHLIFDKTRENLGFWCKCKEHSKKDLGFFKGRWAEKFLELKCVIIGDVIKPMLKHYF